MKKILEAFGEPISHGGQEAFIFNVLRNINMEGLQMDFFTPYYCDNPSAENEAFPHTSGSAVPSS